MFEHKCNIYNSLLTVVEEQERQHYQIRKHDMFIKVRIDLNRYGILHKMLSKLDAPHDTPSTWESLKQSMQMYQNKTKYYRQATALDDNRYTLGIRH